MIYVGKEPIIAQSIDFKYSFFEEHCFSFPTLATLCNSGNNKKETQGIGWRLAAADKQAFLVKLLDSRLSIKIELQLLCLDGLKYSHID